VYLLLTDLHGYAYDVGASKYDRSTAMSKDGGSPITLFAMDSDITDETVERIRRANRDPRKMTKRVYSAMDDGILSSDAVALMCLRAMSEADVAEMLRANEISDI